MNLLRATIRAKFCLCNNYKRLALFKTIENKYFLGISIKTKIKPSNITKATVSVIACQQINE